jgi:predicted metal-dependent phosphoesterase TrpH
VGITVLALTDHDSTEGLAEAGSAAPEHGIRLIAGVEISVTWQDRSLHIVGLNIDPDSAPLRQGLAKLQEIRRERAREMGRRLAKDGIPGVYEAAEAMAQGGMITRTHFAKQLAKLGLAADVRDVFNRYLTRGKPGYVSTRWAEPGEAIGWIKQAGGVAVLAHPQRYKLTHSWLRRMVAEFREAGGEAIEVVSGTASPGDVQSTAEYARRFDLLASVGSDFHSPENLWPRLGRLPPLPAGLVPVWGGWESSEG